MKKLLFLCTGNYYRSRFSEEYVNHFCRKNDLHWIADSAGIQRDFSGNGNVGPIARNTLDYLTSMDIEALGHQRMPKHVQTEDFSSYDRIIAVSSDEHRPMLERYWPKELLGLVDYFDVEDLHIEGPETALPRLVSHLDVLIATLAKESTA